MAVQKVFNQYASEYDEARKRPIPCCDEVDQTVIDSVPFDIDESITVLDLGAGTAFKYKAKKP